MVIVGVAALYNKNCLIDEVMNLSKHLIVDNNGIIIGRFQNRTDRDISLRDHVSFGFPRD
jgi:hypothetical protein